jgi:hypothetical protein
MKKRKPSRAMQVWIDARQRHHPPHAEVQMARELGLNPATGKLGKLDNHDQEPWKMPLREYLQHLYLERSGRAGPGGLASIEAWPRAEAQKKAATGVARPPLAGHTP